MNKLSLLTAKAVLLTSSLAACFGGETLAGHLMPSKCRNDDPKTHTRDCALQCRSTGFGVLTENGDYISFDAAGNKKATELLEKATGRTTDLRVSVQGARKGATLTVESIRWQESK